MHRESTVLENVLTVGVSGTVVGIAGVPNGVDEHAARPQHSPNLIHEGMDFLGRQGHTQRHVRKYRIDCSVL